MEALPEYINAGVFEGVELLDSIPSDRYRNIKTKDNYMSLLNSGMFWEFHPELTGNWYLDEPVINGR